MELKHLDLFSGIGGFALAAKHCGIKTISFVENDDFCCKVLRKHFPEIPIYKDIRFFATEGRYIYNTLRQVNECSVCKEIRCLCIKKDYFIDFHGKPNLITAGFPCQDISNAKTAQLNGLQGLSGEKSSLFYESIRIIDVFRPNAVIFENVPSIRNRGADELFDNMERLNYITWPFILSTDNFGGQIKRQRAWFVSIQKSECQRLQRKIIQKMAYKSERGQDANIAGPDWGRATSQLRGATNGVPNWMDRLKSLGNSLTPQIPYTIMKSIKELYQ
jgi:DNA (cytosine-5)-methyltransferase 1